MYHISWCLPHIPFNAFASRTMARMTRMMYNATNVRIILHSYSGGLSLAYQHMLDMLSTFLRQVASLYQTSHPLYSL